MNKKHTIRNLFITLFTLLLITSFALTGCSSSIEASGAAVDTQATDNAETQSVMPSATEEGSVSYVSIDINPSIELTVKYGVVLDVAAYNDDGTAILLSTDVTGKTPEEATAALISEFAAQGYITPENTDAAIVITVYGDDEDGLLVNIQSAASESLTGLGITCDLVASAVEPDIAQTAKAAGITPGRYLLIKYLADRDGITVEEAWTKYGSMKMKELLNLIPNPGEVYGDDAYVYLASIVAGLTPEQLQILNQAKLAYQTAMKTAVKTYNQAKADARAYFQAARDAAHDAFKATGDKNAWQQAKAAAKQEMQQRYQTAKQAFNTAKTQAQEAFMAAIANLGLTEEQIQAILEWDFDLEWNFDYNWSETEVTAGTDDQTDEQGQEDQDGGDNEEDGGQGNGHGNHGNGNG